MTELYCGIPADRSPAFGGFPNPQRLCSTEWLSTIPGALELDGRGDLNDPEIRDFVDDARFGRPTYPDVERDDKNVRAFRYQDSAPHSGHIPSARNIPLDTPPGPEQSPSGGPGDRIAGTHPSGLFSTLARVLQGAGRRRIPGRKRTVVATHELHHQPGYLYWPVAPSGAECDSLTALNSATDDK